MTASTRAALRAIGSRLADDERVAFARWFADTEPFVAAILLSAAPWIAAAWFVELQRLERTPQADFLAHLLALAETLPRATHADLRAPAARVPTHTFRRLAVVQH